MSSSRPTRGRPRASKTAAVTDEDVDAFLSASRTLVAISAQSIAAAEDVVDLAQFRALVVVASHESMSLGELADAAGMHMSTASRMCDRLVGLGLLNRADDPDNRRQLTLTLTERGVGVVSDVMEQRRRKLEPILAQLPRARRAELVALLGEFAAAAGELSPKELWAMGWPT
jgi:DNA-binding MarR family transcriptional regulator